MLQMDGIVDKSVLFKALHKARDAAMKVNEVQRAALRERFVAHANGNDDYNDNNNDNISSDNNNDNNDNGFGDN